MSENRNILVCTDFSKHADTAFNHAMDQAKKYEAKLHIFHVIMPSDPCANSNSNNSSDSHHSDADEEAGNNQIQQIIGALKQKYIDRLKGNIKEYEFLVKIGTPDVEIVQYAKENDIDVIILGALGIPPHGFGQPPMFQNLPPARSSSFK